MKLSIEYSADELSHGYCKKCKSEVHDLTDKGICSACVTDKVWKYLDKTRTATEQPIQQVSTNNVIKAMGLDPSQPYCLGNKMYSYKRECKNGHGNLTDDQIGSRSGYYDGYYWEEPYCKLCGDWSATLVEIQD